MNKKIIIIAGASASGKDSLAKRFIERFPEYKKSVSFTSRDPREGEIDGKDYHFVDDKFFIDHKNEFVESAVYRGWHYGSMAQSFENYTVSVLTPSGVRAIRAAGIDCTVIYLSVPRPARIIAYLKRQPKDEAVDEGYRRSVSDVGAFDGFETEKFGINDNMVDIVLHNNMNYETCQYIKTLDDLVDEIKTKLDL